MSRAWHISPLLCAGGRLLLLFLAVIPAALRADQLPAAGQIGTVTCFSDTTETYALYLPSTYSATKKWPIIYLFDPSGNGRHPTELYKDLAEKYGFILAGSNTSHNFANDQARHLKAIWDDTHARLALDQRRTYTSGFSGGARVAGVMATSCPSCEVQGVIAHGAGYGGGKPPANSKLLYFLAVGNQDFNWPEVMGIRREREDQGLPYRVRVFDGPHQWAPPEIMEDAISWLMLKSMQVGDMPLDNTLIDRWFNQRRVEATQSEKVNDALGQLAAYRSLTSDFAGLRDVSEFPNKLSALKQSDAFKSAMKNEREQIEEQFSIERAISPKVQTYVEGSAPDPSALRNEIVQAIGALKEQADHAKKESKRLVSARAFADLWVSGMENGQQELELRHYEKAEAAFDLMSQIKNDPWPMMLLADTHAMAGNKKLALRDLHEALRRGLKDTTVLETDPHLESLRSEPEFQKLLDLAHK